MRLDYLLSHLFKNREILHFFLSFCSFLSYLFGCCCLLVLRYATPIILFLPPPTHNIIWITVDYYDSAVSVFVRVCLQHILKSYTRTKVFQNRSIDDFLKQQRKNSEMKRQLKETSEKSLQYGTKIVEPSEPQLYCASRLI